MDDLTARDVRKGRNSVISVGALSTRWMEMMKIRWNGRGRAKGNGKSRPDDGGYRMKWPTSDGVSWWNWRS